jgi:hypothetical protein
MFKAMKYWLYLFAKLAIVAGTMFAMGLTLVHSYPPPPAPLPRFGPAPPLFLNDMGFTLIMFGIWMVGVGLFWLALWDQRRRCRTCLRLLIMPVARGSWANMVILGRPITEVICPYGHGTLSIQELQITGRHLPDWQPHDDDIWKELESYYQAR